MAAMQIKKVIEGQSSFAYLFLMSSFWLFKDIKLGAEADFYLK